MDVFDLPSPSEDLLDWCTKITNDFYGLNVTDLTLSWKNGVAFCAIIHHFRPDLIDYYSLDPEDAKANLRKAFDAAAKLGISMASPEEILILDVPDKLSVITSLHQLRAYFSGKTLKDGNSTTSLDDSDGDDNSLFGFEWSGPKRSDFRHIFSQRDDDLLMFSHYTPSSVSNYRNNYPSDQDIPKKDSNQSSSRQVERKIPSLDQDQSIKETDPKGSISEDITISKALSTPSSDRKPKKPLLMTHKQLTNPLDADSDDEELGLNKSFSTSCKSIRETSLEDSPKDIIDLANTLGDVQDELSVVVQSFHKPTSSTSLSSPSSDPSLSSKALKQSSSSTGTFNNSSLSKSADSTKSSHNSITDRPLEIVPGLLDLSPRKINPPNRLSFRSRIQREPNSIRADIRERARKLFEDARVEHLAKATSKPSDPTDKDLDERQKRLREKARNILAAVKQGNTSISELDNWSSSKLVNADQSSNKPKDNDSITNLSNERNKKSQSDILNSSAEHNFSVNTEKSALQVTNIGRDARKAYVDSEIIKLEKDQQEIDQEAKVTETKLRFIMQKGGNSEEEERYLRKWFDLVNRRHSLLRRQMKLNILKQEKDLERCYKILCKELRSLLSIHEWDKTDVQKESERLLIDQLVQIVDRRDELVHHMDTQEKAAEEDEIMINATEKAINLSSSERNCIIS